MIIGQISRVTSYLFWTIYWFVC